VLGEGDGSVNNCPGPEPGTPVIRGGVALVILAGGGSGFICGWCQAVLSGWSLSRCSPVALCCPLINKVFSVGW
jgi:hypothetical protein